MIFPDLFSHLPKVRHPISHPILIKAYFSSDARNDNYNKKVASFKNHTHFQTRTHKPYLIPDQNGQDLYLILDKKGSKTIPFGAAHTYLAYKREHPPPPPPTLTRRISAVGKRKASGSFDRNFQDHGVRGSRCIVVTSQTEGVRLLKVPWKVPISFQLNGSLVFQIPNF